MINAVILSAGESKRMGRAKALLEFGNETFLGHIVSVLSSSIVEGITVVLGAQAEEIGRAVDLSATTVVINENYKRGQLSSLITAIESAPDETEALLVCLVDMPFITEATVNLLIERFRETACPIVVPLLRGRRGHPVLFARLLFDELRNAPADKGARSVLHSNEGKVLEVPVTDDGVVTSIDTPDNYKSRFGVDL